MTCSHFRAGVIPALLVYFCAGLLAALLLVMPAAAKMRQDTLRVKTATAEHTFRIEIAVDEADKAKGLMFRPVVPPFTGMLFPYDRPEEVTMWMKNTHVSLDMIFIRADGTIHRIARRTEPFSERIVASAGPVTAVLEITGGDADRLGIKAGDKVIHAHFGGIR